MGAPDLLQALGNFSQYAFHIPHHVLIGEAQHAIAEIAQFGVPRRVLGGIMCVAINFNNQLRRRANKVGNEWPDHLLATKLETVQLAV